MGGQWGCAGDGQHSLSTASPLGSHGSILRCPRAVTSCFWCHLQAVAQPAGPAPITANPHLVLMQLLKQSVLSGVPDPRLDEGYRDAQCVWGVMDPVPAQSQFGPSIVVHPCARTPPTRMPPPAYFPSWNSPLVFVISRGLFPALCGLTHPLCWQDGSGLSQCPPSGGYGPLGCPGHEEGWWPLGTRRVTGRWCTAWDPLLPPPRCHIPHLLPSPLGLMGFPFPPAQPQG